MSKHTPGPWKYDGMTYIWGPNKEMIAEIRGYGDKLPQDINAELIAKAPEMMEMLKELEWRGSEHFSMCPICKKARTGPNSDPKSVFYKEGHAKDCKLAKLIGGNDE